ncbi:unnamed protein product, partial [Meganyctiphanes norvegica]
MCMDASSKPSASNFFIKDGDKTWNKESERIRTEGSYDYTCTEARSAPNRNLNRYRDVLPYDHSRIVIDNSSTNYINASLLKVESVNRSYILAQGPLSSTTPHFWLMIWQQKCKGIIMLNKIIEKNQIKCHQYWPLGESQGGQDELDLPSVNLRVSLISSSTHSHYVYRTMRASAISFSFQSQIFILFESTTPPDFSMTFPHDVPTHAMTLFRQGSAVPGERETAPRRPPRLGLWNYDADVMMLAMGLCTGDQAKVLEVLLDMRKARMGLIQTPDQLRFSYQAIIYGSHKISALTNGKDPVESSSSSEEPSLNEELPPAPPPRTDSLTRSMIESQLGEELGAGDEGSDTDVGEGDHHLSDTDVEEELDDDDDDDDVKRKGEGNNCAPARPLPPAPPGDSSGPDSPITPDSNKNMENEVRRRHYQDRNSAMSTKVADMVKKQRDTESWDQKKRLIKRHLSLCVTFLVIGLGGGALYYRYFGP